MKDTLKNLSVRNTFKIQLCTSRIFFTFHLAKLLNDLTNSVRWYKNAFCKIDVNVTKVLYSSSSSFELATLSVFLRPLTFHLPKLLKVRTNRVSWRENDFCDIIVNWSKFLSSSSSSIELGKFPIFLRPPFVNLLSGRQDYIIFSRGNRFTCLLLSFPILW